jgi:GNAT superfamily N-acetyltransferase
VTRPTPALSLSVETEPAQETIRVLEDGLDAYNARFWPDANWAPRYIFARDAAGAVQGGVYYVVAMEWLFVNWLWVAESHRGAGEGTRLIRAAEHEARVAGCRGVYLDTFTFQAPGFYQKLGYSEFGRIADFPTGFDRIWLMKRFS